MAPAIARALVLVLARALAFALALVLTLVLVLALAFAFALALAVVLALACVFALVPCSCCPRSCFCSCSCETYGIFKFVRVNGFRQRGSTNANSDVLSMSMVVYDATGGRARLHVANASADCRARLYVESA